MPAGMAALAAHPQFILVKLVLTDTPGKFNKLPMDWRTGAAADAHKAAIWMPWAQAAAIVSAWGAGYCLGFVLTEQDPFWCLDVDGCVTDQGQWSGVALKMFETLHGAAVELSVSRRGLHFWGTGPVPPHGKKCTALGLELYTEKRFIALTLDVLRGDAGTDHAAALRVLVAEHFPPRAETAAPAAGPSGPCAEWRGPEDDDDLLRLAIKSTSVAAAFGGSTRASFAELWAADPEALQRAYPGSGGRAYDASSADAAIAQHLAYWTGKDAGRIERLMRRSSLLREKWDREDYMHRTIAGAVARQDKVLQVRVVPTVATTSPSAAAAMGITDANGREMLFSTTPLHTARVLLSRRYGGDRLRCWQGVFYVWDGAGWRALTSDDVRAVVYQFLESEAPEFHPNQARVTQVVDALKSEAHILSRMSPPCWLSGAALAPAEELVSCSSGLLHLPSRTLHPPTPRYFNLNALPVPYDPNAAAPLAWLAFLRTVWPDDPEAIAVLQELFGYLLTPDTGQQKLFLIVGPKRSGKGTITRVLRALLGPDNVASPTLTTLGGNFGLASLVGKLAALISDAKVGGRADPKVVAENLLRISGEDAVEVDRKFLPAASLKLGVRFVLLTNELPKIADASGALASRFVVLTMTNSFLGREDHGLTARLLGELPGILNWAVDGWARLAARGYFVAPASSASASQDLADLGSPIGEFVRDACRTGPDTEVAVGAIYLAWQTWCASKGLRPGNEQTFGRDLRTVTENVTVYQPRRDGERERFYRGIGLQGARWHATQSIAANLG